MHAINKKTRKFDNFKPVHALPYCTTAGPETVSGSNAEQQTNKQTISQAFELTSIDALVRRDSLHQLAPEQVNFQFP